jgi:cell division protein FtsI/penicillin-binding protein 2
LENQNRKKSHFPVRLNILFFSVFLLFSVLILRLGFVQIVYGENFKRDLARKEDITISSPVPRGRMLDREYRIIVDNVPKSAISYTNEGFSQSQMLETAEKLAKLINKKTDKVTERDKRDFWIMINPERADAKIIKREKELYNANKLSDNDIYKLKIERISTQELEELNKERLEVLALYKEFNSGYKFTTQIIKNEGVTAKELAVVSENLQSLPGVDTTTDWERCYAFNRT